MTRTHASGIDFGEEVRIRIAINNGFTDVSGVRLNTHFALTPGNSGKLEVLTHLPSGRRIPASFGPFTLATGKIYVDRLMTLPINWADDDWRLFQKLSRLTEEQIAMLHAPLPGVES
jgi:hypothetical protein